MGVSKSLENIKKLLPLYGVVDELSFIQAISFFLYSLLFSVTVLSFKSGYYKQQLTQLTWTCLTLIVVVAQLKFAVFMIHEGLFWFLFPVSLVIANDTFAYFCGMALGKKIFKSPFLKLSPNKTWEGFFGALIFTVLYAYYGSIFWGQIDFIRCGFEELKHLENNKDFECFSDHLFKPIVINTGYFSIPIQRHAVNFALFASLIAPFGGFFASAIKRAFKIKDFESFIPGHGGAMDRFDCQLIMSTFTYVYYSTFIGSLHLLYPIAQIKTMLSSLNQDEQKEIYNFLQNLINK